MTTRMNFVPEIFREWEGLEFEVDPETGCWNWLMRKERGYGRTWRGHPRGKVAHVAYWERAHGPMPEGKELDHVCRNRGCVNPDPLHTEPVTRSENRQRASKVTLEQVLAVRAAGINGAEAGRRLDISARAGWMIVTRRSWRNV